MEPSRNPAEATFPPDIARLVVGTRRAEGVDMAHRNPLTALMNVIALPALGALLALGAVGCADMPSDAETGDAQQAINTNNGSYLVVQDPGFEGVYYQTSNGQCPRGGQLAFGGSFCKVSEGGDIVPVVDYWIDQDPRWPGVFYHQVNGACPYGGALSGQNNCKATVLDANRHYWIDQDPRWPGVFYKQVNGACPAGGSVSGPNCKVSVLQPAIDYHVDTSKSVPGVLYTQVDDACGYGGVKTGDSPECRVVNLSPSWACHVITGGEVCQAGSVIEFHMGNADNDLTVTVEKDYNARTVRVVARSTEDGVFAYGGTDTWTSGNLPLRADDAIEDENWSWVYFNIEVSLGDGDDYFLGQTKHNATTHDVLAGAIVKGQGGSDTIYYAQYQDGGDYKDFLFGSDLNDELRGGPGGDELHGGAGNDKLYGQGGWDEIWGNDGDDRLDGGDGTNTCHGGSGKDAYHACAADST
jgi:Ca2+-binding RTX toxin-like protein